MARRRTKFNEGRRRALITALRTGLPVSAAAAAIGVSPATVGSWYARGRRENAPLFWRLFSDEFDQAVVDGEYALAMVVIEAAIKDRDVRAAQWLLERRYPQNWSRAAQLDVRHSGDVFFSPRDELEAGRKRALELVPGLGEIVDAQEETG